MWWSPQTCSATFFSDLGPACTGTIGIAPSGNINPEGKFPSLLSSRCTARHRTSLAKGVANPIGQIWSGAMMLDHLGYRAAHDALLKAIETVTAEGPRTPDMGGKASTTEVGIAVEQALANFKP